MSEVLAEYFPVDGYLRPFMDPWPFTIQVYTLGLSPHIMPTNTLSIKGVLYHKP